MITTMMGVIIVIIILVLLMILVLKKVSHNMILMSKHKGQHGGKKGKKIPPFSGNARKKTFFLTGGAPYSIPSLVLTH